MISLPNGGSQQNIGASEIEKQLPVPLAQEADFGSSKRDFEL